MLNSVSYSSDVLEAIGAAANHHGDAVQGTFRYLAPRASKARIVVPEHGPVQREAQYDVHQMPVHDLRPLATGLSLDVQGFELVTVPSEVLDFQDDEEVRAVYYPETEQLLRQRTGADRVLIFDHTVRSEADGARKPVHTVHNDYTTRSGPQRVCDLLDADEAASRLEARFAVVNTWRPINRPVFRAPLAIADARSVAAEHFVATDLVYADRIGEIYDVAHHPVHKWYYAPRMTPTEALLLKTYDSATDGRARFAAHSAFDDPRASHDAPPRESIEVRALLFFNEVREQPG